MQGDGCLVEVALPVEAGGIHKLLELRDAPGRLEVLVEEGAKGLEVEINDAVGLGQQARRLGRGFGAQEDGHGQKDKDRGHYPERSAGASVHGPSEITYHSGRYRRHALVAPIVTALPVPVPIPRSDGLCHR